jgi:hypothetical protein
MTIKASCSYTFSVIVLSGCDSDGARWVLDSYQVYAPLHLVERAAEQKAHTLGGVYSICLNDEVLTLVRKNY